MGRSAKYRKRPISLLCGIKTRQRIKTKFECGDHVGEYIRSAKKCWGSFEWWRPHARWGLPKPHSPKNCIHMRYQLPHYALNQFDLPLHRAMQEACIKIACLNLMRQ